MEQTVKRVTCIKAISAQQLFQEALDQIYSHRYFAQQQKHLDSELFVFSLSIDNKTLSLFKGNSQLLDLLADQDIRTKISKQTLELINSLPQLSLQRKGQVFEQVLQEICIQSPQSLSLPFFQKDKMAYHSFKMRKLSGGRYKESMCCKMGSIFKAWKERRVDVYLKGVGYYNEKGQLRQFLSYSQGFHFEFGRPKTGKQFGITLYANHRRLSLEATNVRDFIYFLFMLRKTCSESCYMTLNRFNSFSPIRNSNSVTFLVDGEEYFEAVAAAIQRAKFSLLISGWMLSPQFLLLRKEKHVSVEELLVDAAKRDVKISVILYHQSCFLPNDSRYFKEKLQEKSLNITVIRHPCGKLPVLWSHHSKLLVIDETQAFIGGFDMTYGRYDDNQHQIFGQEGNYPGIEYNNIRTNDQLEVRNPKFPSIMRNQARLPWHDVGLSVKGKVVSDLAHHFYQLWHFVKYQNKQNAENEQNFAPSLFEVDLKSVFSTKAVPQEEPTTLFQQIQNKVTTLKKTLKKKGRQVVKKVRNQIKKIGRQQEENQKIKIRLSANEDYFQKYFLEVNHQINKKQQGEQRGEKKDHIQNQRRRSRNSKLFSIDQVKEAKESLQAQDRWEGIRKTNSSILCGDKIIDYMTTDIDHDYVHCLDRINQKREINSVITQQDSQIESDEEEEQSSQLCQGKYGQLTGQDGHDQCQVVRSVGHWSIGCHPNSTEFSIQIAYLQLISQAKHYIYIENQFFISSTADPSTVKNDVAYALYLRIVKAIEHDQLFRVYIILPLIPGFSGDLQNQQCLLLRREMQWQYDTICRTESSLWKRLLEHTNDPGKYIQFFGLRNHGRYDEMSSPTTEIIYLHSKLMIIDDQIVLCGSANINDRSLAGDRDSELAMVVRGEDFVQGLINAESCLVSQLAHELRLKLWKEHFDCPQEEILDPVCEDTWEIMTNRAQENTSIYRRIFGCYPDNEMTTRKKITEIRQASDIYLYNELKDNIKGHIVEFPLDFLSGEPLSCFITEKQFYMPAECLT